MIPVPSGNHLSWKTVPSQPRSLSPEVQQGHADEREDINDLIAAAMAVARRAECEEKRHSPIIEEQERRLKVENALAQRKLDLARKSGH